MGYRCANYSKDENGCKFYVGKIAGIMLETEQMEKLIKEGKTDKITGFTSKKGNLFDARLKFDEAFNIVFDFEE